MNGGQSPADPKRTAVLVVHGMGTQRPLETVRGVVDAVWLKDGNKIWTHPERSGTDIDLPVITTSEVPGAKGRRADFHELYWSHLMSETRALAVLLWLFELARKGPRFTARMNELWWGTAIFLQLLILSIALLTIQATAKFADLGKQPQSLLLAPILMFLILGGLSLGAALLQRKWRLALWSGCFALILAAVIYVVAKYAPEDAAGLFGHFLPALVALIATLFLMGGKWGLRVFALTYALSFLFEWLLRWTSLVDAKSWWPWSIYSQWCTAAAFIVIGTYLVVNAAFLQPYLGDAARYFRNAPSNVAVRREIRRQAVNMLAALHLCGKYDRIVVVAHSLGTVVAYDMLRAYFGRIFRQLPDPKELGAILDEVDSGKLDAETLREKARLIVGQIAKAVDAKPRIMSERALPADDDDSPKAWLVTDFITLGSPLTHAHYLMCKGKDADELKKDFVRRVEEREFPTCPPRILPGDRLLTYIHRASQQRRFHHGAQFGLTRWTNLYFPMSQLFWGDAIGGPVGPAFGEAVFDVPVYTERPGAADFFTHVTYWDIKRKGGRDAPHIVTLRNAIDLADTGIVNKRDKFPSDRNGA